ncbi:MAG: helix-turn-helix domain-containing protein [Clostridiales bacterium]|nr:helix-turn-helix domain-containing protein [Clostridiales bacterium]
MNFAERLKAIRLDRDMTQKDVYTRLRISPNGYASYEQGRTEPGIETIIQLCKIFEISTDYLLGSETEFGEKNHQTTRQEHYTQDEQQLIETYRTLSPGKKRALFDMLEISTEIQSKKKA